MNDFELGFIVGLVEGEGTISLSMGKSKIFKQGFALCPRFYITNTNLQLLSEAKRIIGGIIFKAKSKNTKHKDKYKLCIDGLKVKSFLLEILPYLITKKKQCELAIKYIDIHKRRCGYSMEEQGLYNYMKKLNKRGLMGA